MVLLCLCVVCCLLFNCAGDAFIAGLIVCRVAFIELPKIRSIAGCTVFDVNFLPHVPWKGLEGCYFLFVLWLPSVFIILNENMCGIWEQPVWGNYSENIFPWSIYFLVFLFDWFLRIRTSNFIFDLTMQNCIFILIEVQKIYFLGKGIFYTQLV